jgi:hypothetical protein
MQNTDKKGATTLTREAKPAAAVVDEDMKETVKAKASLLLVGVEIWKVRETKEKYTTGVAAAVMSRNINESLSVKAQYCRC